MSQTPLEAAEALRIGTVEYVAANEIKVILDIEAPDSIALNTGEPRPFPRVNSYLLVPVDEAYLVGQIEWIKVEPAPFPKRRGLKDFGLVDLPYPLRCFCLNQLAHYVRSQGMANLYFAEGLMHYLLIGAPVLIPQI